MESLKISGFMGKLVKILPKTCNILALRRKMFVHSEVEIVVIHAEIVVQGLECLKQ
jgi:hypothetical protein